MQQSRRNNAEESWETGVEIAGPAVPGLDEILSAEACAFVAMLERRFGAERRRLLAARAAFQARIDAGENPAFRPETKAIRDSRVDHCGPRLPTSPTGVWRSPARWTAR